MRTAILHVQSTFVHPDASFIASAAISANANAHRDSPRAINIRSSQRFVHRFRRREPMQTRTVFRRQQLPACESYPLIPTLYPSLPPSSTPMQMRTVFRRQQLPACESYPFIPALYPSLPPPSAPMQTPIADYSRRNRHPHPQLRRRYRRPRAFSIQACSSRTHPCGRRPP